jgi:F-type H+-transporting ATPase subunit a
MLPLAIIPGFHAFTTTSHFSITGLLAIMSFAIVLIVGFWRHGLHFFSLFMFILVSNLLGMLPLGIIPGLHAFTTTSHFSITGLLAIMSFSLVLIIGFGRHKLRFFSLFVPHGTPWFMLPLIIPIEIISFMVRPFSLLLRLFVAMMSGHILMEVFGSFIVNGFDSGTPMGFGVGIISFIFIVGVGALELLVCALQAYVFALLTSLYLNDAINLH